MNLDCVVTLYAPVNQLFASSGSAKHAIQIVQLAQHLQQ
jgi:hypothetical protein